jgi:hypothetical protein
MISAAIIKIICATLTDNVNPNAILNTIKSKITGASVLSPTAHVVDRKDNPGTFASRLATALPRTMPASRNTKKVMERFIPPPGLLIINTDFLKVNFS